MPTVAISAARDIVPPGRVCDGAIDSVNDQYSKRKRARGITIHIIRAAVTMSRAPDNDVSGNRQTVASGRHEFAALI
jgi:hypothetical protein